MAQKDADEAYAEARELIVHEGQEMSTDTDTGLGKMIEDGGYFDNNSGIEAYRQIIGRIMHSTTVEEVLRDEEPGSLEDLSGQIVEIEGFKLNVSEFESGANYYAYITVTPKGDDSAIGVTSGQQSIIAQLMALHNLKAFPVTAKVKPSRKPNKYGRIMYRFVPVG